MPNLKVSPAEKVRPLLRVVVSISPPNEANLLHVCIANLQCQAASTAKIRQCSSEYKHISALAG